MQTVVRSYCIRAYPNAAQRRMLDRWFGATRWLWNTALAIRNEGHRSADLRLTGNDLSRWLTQWKRTAGHEWLNEIPATCLTRCLRNQDKAFANFFSKRAKRPRFKQRVSGGSLRFEDVGPAWDRGVVRLTKLGAVKLAEKLPAVARPGEVTVRKDGAGRYFVSFHSHVEVQPLPVTGRTIGVDLGLAHLATLSSGEKVEAPKHYRNAMRYLRRQQRCLARRVKGSKRREKQKLVVARAHARIADLRSNSLHQLTTRLVREFDVIAIEDLNVKGLARARNSLSIHDAAFGEFRRQLTYKANWYGRTLITCDRFFPSSKTCSKCSHRLDEMRLDVRHWTCPKCGADHDRDINAAQNLLTDSLRQLAGGDRRDYCVEPGGTGEAQANPVPGVEARSGRKRGSAAKRPHVASVP